MTGRLDSLGHIKIQTLEDATLLLQRVNGLVEQYALAVKRGQSTMTLIAAIRRTLPTLAENLKNQFAAISEMITTLNLTTSRGASENIRVRALREGVAQIKQAIDLATLHTRDRHTVHDEDEEGEEGEEAGPDAASSEPKPSS
jgi:hypothetical protein